MKCRMREDSRRHCNFVGFRYSIYRNRTNPDFTKFIRGNPKAGGPFFAPLPDHRGIHSRWANGLHPYALGGNF